MKKIHAFLVIVVILISCVKKEDTSKSASDKKVATKEQLTQQENEDLQLFKQTCYACHSVVSKSHDEIIAPPMAAVKMRYLMSYPEREDFINAVVSYASDPKAENALMFGAVQQFKAMPKQNFKEEDLKRIAAYIYDHDIEQPEWFNDHFAEEHPNGMGMGRGQGGRGMGMGNGRGMRMQQKSVSDTIQ